MTHSERWWDLWTAECQRHLSSFDLGSANLVNGRQALVISPTTPIPRIVIDEALAELLVAEDAGLVLIPWLKEAIRTMTKVPPGWKPGRSFSQPSHVDVPLPRLWRARRRAWIRRKQQKKFWSHD